MKAIVQAFSTPHSRDPYIHGTRTEPLNKDSTPSGWVALTPSVEVELPELPKEEVVPQIVERIEERRKALHQGFLRASYELDCRKADLLALPAPPPPPGVEAIDTSFGDLPF